MNNSWIRILKHVKNKAGLWTLTTIFKERMSIGIITFASGQEEYDEGGQEYFEPGGEEAHPHLRAGHTATLPVSA